MGSQYQVQKRCHICVDPQCEGRQDCNCDTCDHADRCYRVLRPTIRITLKCTQSCSHCCYSCSPKETTHMTIEMAKKVKIFMVNNDISTHIELMGGEFFCNPDWYEIFTILSKDVFSVRVVTNGDWATNPDLVIKYLEETPQAYVALSEDQWHTNQHVDKAVDICEKYGFIYRVATEEQTTSDSNVPVGRSQYDYNYYSSLGQYCTKPDHKYTFLIDEQGEIYKCGFGIWDYDNVDGYLEGGFAERFKNFNLAYYKTWIPNCASCIEAYRGMINERK